MAALREVPFGLYYGSVDSTPLFVLLAGLYAERTGDVATLRELWPNVEAALAWIDGPGDPDRRRLRRISSRATRAGWSTKAGRIPTTRSSMPTAASRTDRSRSCEVQGYVYAASGWRRAAPAVSARTSAPRRSIAQADALAAQFRRGVLVRGDRHLCAGARRREAAVPRAHLQCRAGAVHRHRAAGARRRGRRAT